MSSHKVPVSLNAVNSGNIDVLIFLMNPAFDVDVISNMERAVNLFER